MWVFMALDAPFGCVELRQHPLAHPQVFKRPLARCGKRQPSATQTHPVFLRIYCRARGLFFNQDLEELSIGVVEQEVR